jgi:hypothetical protein
MASVSTTSAPDQRAESLVVAYERAGYRRTAPAILQPAEPFLDLSGEDIRRRMFLTADTEGRLSTEVLANVQDRLKPFAAGLPAGAPERRDRQWAIRELEHTADLLEAQLATFRDGLALFRVHGRFPGKRENLRLQLEHIWKPSRAAEILEVATAGSEE